MYLQHQQTLHRPPSSPDAPSPGFSQARPRPSPGALFLDLAGVGTGPGPLKPGPNQGHQAKPSPILLEVGPSPGLGSGFACWMGRYERGVGRDSEVNRRCFAAAADELK